MIKRLTVNNFKCLRNIDISLGHFNVLIGPNDTGKTSFLDALLMLSKISTTTTLEHCFQDPLSLEKIKWIGSSEANIQFGLQYKDIDYSLEVTTAAGKPVVKNESLRNPESILLQLQSKESALPHEYKIAYKGQIINTSPQCSALATYQHTPEDELTQIATLLKNIKCYTLKPSQLARNSYLDPDKLQEPQLDTSGYGLPSILSILASTAPEDPRYQEIKKYLREAIPQIMNFGIAPVSVRCPVFSKLESSIETTQYLDVTGQSLYFELKDHKNQKIPASLMSDGLLLILGYLTLVYTTKHPSILLVEEPENGIHPKLLKFVVELLRGLSRGLPHTSPIQIIMTTQSPYLLDCAALEEVYIFQKDEQGASTITPMAEVKGLDKWLSEYMLGELWYNWGEKELVRRAKK